MLNTRAEQKGVSLIEVMVAILVLSIGLLGMAGLQAATAKFQQGSSVRGSIATLLSEITSRVQANSGAAGNNVATGGTSSSIYTLTDNWTTQQAANLVIASNCEAPSILCSSTERAAYDMLIWRQRVRANIPLGAVIVSGDQGIGFDVTFMWLDKNTTANAGATKGVADDTAALVASNTCVTSAETAGINRLSQQTCCPAVAAVPAGVRCLRFGFVP